MHLLDVSSRFQLVRWVLTITSVLPVAAIRDLGLSLAAHVTATTVTTCFAALPQIAHTHCAAFAVTWSLTGSDTHTRNQSVIWTIATPCCLLCQERCSVGCNQSFQRRSATGVLSQEIGTRNATLPWASLLKGTVANESSFTLSGNTPLWPETPVTHVTPGARDSCCSVPS